MSSKKTALTGIGLIQDHTVIACGEVENQSQIIMITEQDLIIISDKAQPFDLFHLCWAWTAVARKP